VVHKLLIRGADIGIINHDKQTAKDIVEEYGYENLQKLFEKDNCLTVFTKTAI
jgi:hypothetical protein